MASRWKLCLKRTIRGLYLVSVRLLKWEVLVQVHSNLFNSYSISNRPLISKTELQQPNPRTLRGLLLKTNWSLAVLMVKLSSMTSTRSRTNVPGKTCPKSLFKIMHKMVSSHN